MPLRIGHLRWLAMLLAVPAGAQTYTVQAIANGNAGTVAAGATGVTVFQLDGLVTKVSGSGGFVSGTTSSPLVTINCINGIGSANSCANNKARLKVTRTGVNTGRAQTITDMTAQAVSPATIVSGTSSGPGTLDFVLGGWTAAGTRQFKLAALLPILGDDGSTATTATSQFKVAVAKNTTNPSGGTNGTVQATVRKAIRVTKLSDIEFGTIIKPASGSGTVTINATTGARTAGGANPPVLRPGTTGRGLFSITGQSGSAFTVAGPATFNITHGSDVLIVTLSSTATGAQTLAGGTFSLGVGGTIPIASTTPVGAYSGDAVLTLTYN